MFWKKKPEADPLGVPLSTLLVMLNPTTIKARREGNTIVADHGTYTTRVEVVPPEDGRSANVPIQAVVRVTAGLPKPLGQDPRFQSAEAAAALNAFASLGPSRHWAARLAWGPGSRSTKARLARGRRCTFRCWPSP